MTTAEKRFLQFWESHEGICYEATARAAFDAGREQAEAQLAGMRAEGCAAVAALENIFVGVTTPEEIERNDSTVVRVAEIASDVLVMATVCTHKAQRDKAVKVLRALNTLIGCGCKANQTCSRFDCRSVWLPVRRLLASLTEEEPEQDYGAGTSSTRQNGQPCERVSVCCQAPQHPTPATIGRADGYCGKCNVGTSFTCDTHHRPWGECPAAKELGAIEIAEIEKP